MGRSYVFGGGQASHQEEEGEGEGTAIHRYFGSDPTYVKKRQAKSLIKGYDMFEGSKFYFKVPNATRVRLLQLVGSSEWHSGYAENLWQSS